MVIGLFGFIIKYTSQTFNSRLFGIQIALANKPSISLHNLEHSLTKINYKYILDQEFLFW